MPSLLSSRFNVRVSRSVIFCRVARGDIMLFALTDRQALLFFHRLRFWRGALDGQPYGHAATRASSCLTSGIKLQTYVCV